jgi:hypothetical protein
LLNGTGEIHIFDKNHVKPGHWRATRHSEKRNLRRNSSRPGRQIRRSTFCPHFSQPTKNEDTVSRRIPAKI